MAVVEQVASSTGWSNAEHYSQGGISGEFKGDRSSVTGDKEPFLARRRRAVLLNRVVEAEILPRLAMTHIAPPPQSSPGRVTTRDDTDQLVQLLLGNEDSAAWGFIELLEVGGATPSSLYLGVITDAARRLGELWEDDRCDFAQVSISLGRLQQLVRALSPSFQTAAVVRSMHTETILLLPAPNEQHTIGLVILSEFFLREGWHVIGGPSSTGYDAAAMVRGAWVDVIGFSLGSMSKLDGLTANIRAVRKASRNPSIGVMVGGPLFLRQPELTNRVGADTTAPDAISAVRQARSLVAMRAAAE